MTPTGPGAKGVVARLAGRIPQFGRYLLTAGMGLVVDLSLASALVLLVGLPDAAASAAGLFAGMVFNYLVHVSWTFRSAGRRPSLGHFLQYAAAVGVTLVIRIAVLMALPPLGLAALLPPPARLFLAAVVSLAASWWLSRHLIFRPPPPAGPS